jgi:tetratricopeptide (TPR) repeat protein
MRRLGLVIGLALVSLVASSDALAQVGSIRGKVLDNDGNPVVDAVIVVRPTQGMGLTFKAKTKKDGAFVLITSQTSGPFTVKVSKEGFKTWESEGPMKVPLGGDPIPLEVRLGPDLQKASEARAQAFGTASGLLQEAEATRQAGDTAGAQKKLDEAEKAFQELLAKNPSNSRAYFNLALVHDARQQWQQAVTSYLKAAELEPALTDAYVGAGAALINTRQSAKAIEVLEKGLATSAGHVRLEWLLGLARYNERSFPGAIEMFEKVKESAPADPEPYYYLGMIALDQNRIEDAKELLRKYVSMQSPNAGNRKLAEDLLAALDKK